MSDRCTRALHTPLPDTTTERGLVTVSQCERQAGHGGAHRATTKFTWMQE